MHVQKPPRGIVADIRNIEPGDYIYRAEKSNLVYRVVENNCEPRSDELWDVEGTIECIEIESKDDKTFTAETIASELENPYLGSVTIPKTGVRNGVCNVVLNNGDIEDVAGIENEWQAKAVKWIADKEINSECSSRKDVDDKLPDAVTP